MFKEQIHLSYYKRHPEIHKKQNKFCIKHKTTLDHIATRCIGCISYEKDNNVITKTITKEPEKKYSDLT